MTQPETPASGRPFRDRSTRLVVLGVLAVILGGLGILLGLAHVAVLGLGGAAAADRGMPSDPRAYAMGFLLYATLGGVFVGLGIGSLRRRRWAPPLMVIVGRIWILGGLTLLVFLPGLLDAALAGVAGSLSDPAAGRVLLLFKLTTLAVVAVVGVVVPAVFVRAYRHPDVPATCREHDRSESWTERCSPTALGLSVGLGACAALLLPLALQPVVPLFGRLVRGGPAAAMIVALAAACGGLAWMTYRQRSSGWWISTALTLVVGVSILITLARVDPAEMYRALGYSDRELRMLEGTALLSRSVHAWLTALLTVACLGYMAAIRRHFRPGGIAGRSEAEAQPGDDRAR